VEFASVLALRGCYEETAAVGSTTEDCGDGAEEAGCAGDDERDAAGQSSSERSPLDDEDGDHVDRDLDGAAQERAQVDAHRVGQVSGKQRQREVHQRTREPDASLVMLEQQFLYIRGGPKTDPVPNF